MNTLIDQLKLLFLFPFYLVKLFIYLLKTDSDNLPGKEFAEFGYKTGLRLLFKGKFSPKLLLNPVSIVRYFEFDFVKSSLNLTDKLNILDVSSPYLFGFYLCRKEEVNYTYINPDKRDLYNVQSLANRLDFSGSYTTVCADARTLDYADNMFDVVLSISVIEHVNDGDDSRVMKELWRVVKPGGLLILTFPVKPVYEEEFRDNDIYKLDGVKKEEGYFFQRLYDEENITKRLLSSIDNYKIINKKVFGETSSDFYNGYKERWIKNGYSETVKDAYYISKYFRYFNNINELKGIGVMGLTLKKIT
jgi:SAM-dependent methyltransferase